MCCVSWFKDDSLQLPLVTQYRAFPYVEYTLCPTINCIFFKSMLLLPQKSSNFPYKQFLDSKTITQPFQVLWIWFSSTVLTIMTKWKKLFFIKKMPYWKATYRQEKVSDVFIIVTAADRNLIYKNIANTSSLTWWGCVRIFEPETFFYVRSIPKP